MALFYASAGSKAGKSHRSRGIACQDSSGCVAGEGFAAAAVSDGHGGDRYFRSDAGSRIAVGCALDALRGCAEEDFLGSFGRDPGSSLEKLAAEIVRLWERRVLDYDSGHPITKDEALWIAEKRIQQGDPLKAYGATLICCFLSERAAFCIQIGDGLAACIGDQDSIPVPDDPECRFNITASLCQNDPMRSFRYWHADGDVPDAIVLATDGVTNTFEDSAGFLRFCRAASCFPLDSGGLWPRLMHKICARSDSSGGDDVSMAAVCRESPEMRCLKDSTDARYRALDLATAVPARKRGIRCETDGMVFEACPGGVALASCRRKDVDVAVPAMIRCGSEVLHVVSIGPKSFSKSSAHSVSIPYTVLTVESKAFYKCPHLEKAEFAGNPEIRPKAFFCCPRIRL